MKIFALFLRCAACAMILFVGIGRPAHAESVRFWTALPEPDQTVMAELVQTYNQQHTIQVDYRNFASNDELLHALQGSKVPELALIESIWIPQLKTRIVPADDVLSAAGSMVRAVAHADTFKQIWDACVFDGKLYALPFSAETAALVINPRHFKKVPLISDINQLRKIEAALEKEPVNVIPVMLPMSWEKSQLGELWTTFAFALAQPPKRKNAQDENPRPFSLKEENDALSLWWKWKHENSAPPTEFAPLPEGFIHGASWILTTREVASLKERNVVELLPKAKRPWAYLEVKALVFFDPQESWSFANYLTDYPEIKTWSMKTPTVPVNKQVYLSPDYIADMDAHRPWMRTFIAAIGQFPVALSFSEERYGEVGETVAKSLTNEMKVQDGALKIHEALFGTPAKTGKQ